MPPDRLPTGPAWRREDGDRPRADGGRRRQAGKARRPSRAWRDNVEAIAMAIVMALVLKYFIVEAYKIPTGSMQPTLMGDEHTGVFDRILVDKLSYRFRDPARFEVVVFRYPLDRSKNFVKRIVGMPGEELRIELGDAWVRTDPRAAWKIPRRPRSVQRSTWKRLHAAGETPWDLSEPDTWTRGPGRIEARGDGRARYAGAIRDEYVHGYPDVLRPDVQARRPGSGRHAVGDVRLAGKMRALAGAERVVIELTEGARRYTFLVPGPAADESAAPVLSVTGVVPGAPDPPRVRLDRAWRLPAGRAVAFGAQNLDDLLELEVDGELLLAAEVPPAHDQSATVALRVDGEGVDFLELAVSRDIYYLPGPVPRASIPEGSYYVLGDNTQDSSDSREWNFVRFAVEGTPGPGGVRVLRGNHRQSDNPRYLVGGPAGSEVLLRDEWGERHRFPLAAARKLPPVPAPFVERDLVLGRALCVFWPLEPWRDVVRLRWVR